LNQLRFFLGEAWEYLIRGRATSLASLVALLAVFFLFTLVLLVSHNVGRLAAQFESRKGLTLFLVESVSSERAAEMAVLFEGFGEIRTASFINRDDALAELEEELGGFPIGSTLGENPLPHTLRLELAEEAAERPGGLAGLAHELENYEQVDEVIYGDQWVETLDQNLRLVRLANLSVGGLATLAVVVVLLTTLKLLFVGRRDTLRILKIVGATDPFIRTPFLFLGGIQCAIAAVLALLFLDGARIFFEALFPGVAPLPLLWKVSFVGGAIALGVLASQLAIEPALRRLEQDGDEVVR